MMTLKGSDRPRGRPAALESILVYLAALAYTAFAGRQFSRLGGSEGPMLFTLGLGLLPLLYALARGFSLPVAFRLAPPRQRDVAGGLLMSMGLFVFVLFVCNVLVYAVPSLSDRGAPLRDFMVRGNPLVAILAVAILPAVCEEFLFRGFILTGLASSVGRWPAILVCAFLFGALHLQPVQMPFTAIIGIALSYAALETGSLAVPVVMHCAHNLFLLMIVRRSASELVSADASQAISMRDLAASGAPALVVFWVSIVLVTLILMGSAAFFVYVGIRMMRKGPTPAGEGDGGRD